LTTKIEAELADIVSRYWAQWKRPILLSLLGESLSTEAQQEKRDLGNTLADIIRSRMAGSLRVVQVPRHGNGVVPYNETNNLSDEELTIQIPPPKVRTDEPIGDSSHVVQKEIWVLFRRGPVPGKFTYVEIPVSGPAIVHHSDGKGSEESGWIEVAEDDFPEMSDGYPGASPAATGNAIRAWATKHSIPMDRIQRPRENFYSSTQNFRTGGIGQPDLSAFVSGMNLLQPSELARIFIPADIVISLIIRSGSKI
jgi:hypothetical protein